MNLFSMINTAAVANPNANRAAPGTGKLADRRAAIAARKLERAQTLMAELAAGKRPRGKTDKVAVLNPGRTCAHVFLILQAGVSHIDLLTAVPDLDARFNAWEGAHAAILAAAQAKKVDLAAVRQVFAISELVEPLALVPASGGDEPATDDEETETVAIDEADVPAAAPAAPAAPAKRGKGKRNGKRQAA